MCSKSEQFVSGPVHIVIDDHACNHLEAWPPLPLVLAFVPLQSCPLWLMTYDFTIEMPFAFETEFCFVL